MKGVFKIFFDFIPKKFYPLIADYAKILIPALITYIATRYTLKKPHQYEIRENQFNKVYLPLYLLKNQCKYFKNPGDKSDILLFIRKTEKLIYKNYPYVYPKTIKLFDILKEESVKKKPNLYHLSNFEYQINYDYEKLKRYLGYPTNSFIDFFKRLNIINKLLYSLFIVLASLDIFTITSSLIYLLNGDLVNGISALIIFAFISFLLYILSLTNIR